MKFVVTISHSEVCFNGLLNEAIVCDEIYVEHMIISVRKYFVEGVVNMSY